MADPFDALRAPLAPADPDPSFAARLRARIERALDLPRGVAVSATAATPITSEPARRDVGAAVPYLAVADGRRAIDWYVDVLGARLRGEPIVMPDGRIGHAELELGTGALYLAEEFPDIGVLAPRPDGTSVTLVLDVPDVDATVGAAVAAGGRVTGELREAYGSRNATVVDPFGHRWMLETPLPAAPQSRQGDIGYASLWVPDAERAADFYADVLGWEYDGSGPNRRVRGSAVPLGVVGDRDRATLFCCYAVDDVDAAVRRVRDAGGTAAEPDDRPYGRVADCTDDQGTDFAVYELAPGAARPPANGARAGDLAYVTLEVVDSARFRAFYGAVLGWRFSPGSIADGWQVDDAVPMTGFAGGAPEATGVPMWRVDDIAAAVERVRAAGGTAGEPQRQPYGLMADCVDDQGVRFYLGQL